MSNAVLTTSLDHASALHRSLADRPALVVGLCAAWCNTCTEFGAGFESLAASLDSHTFVWLDIEDDADLAGDIDVENFPTIAVYHQGRLLHFGVSLPQPGVIARLVGALDEYSRTVVGDPAVTSLPARLQEHALRGNQRLAAPSSASPSKAETN